MNLHLLFTSLRSGHTVNGRICCFKCDNESKQMEVKKLCRHSADKPTQNKGNCRVEVEVVEAVWNNHTESRLISINTQIHRSSFTERGNGRGFKPRVHSILKEHRVLDWWHIIPFYALSLIKLSVSSVETVGWKVFSWGCVFGELRRLRTPGYMLPRMKKKGIFPQYVI